MIFTLENEYIKVGISSLGAELCSLKTLNNGLEYIWQASPQVWPRHAPILFPIVGKLKNNSFTFNNEEFHLSQHGFARDKEFEMIKHNNDTISLKLKADSDSKKHYPFNFELITYYFLEKNVVRIIYEVLNPESDPLFFSIGAHPGFRCPLFNGENFEDYFMEFEQNETLIKHKIKDGLISDEQELFVENTKNLPLNRQIFNDDALVFKRFKSKFITIKNNLNPHQITVSLDGFPYLGIWTKPSAESTFICIEPWYGIADAVHANGEFTNKEGIIKLEGGEKFNCSYSMEVS
ncbi:aldose 1-epimerase family protein [soil metagenome]